MARVKPHLTAKVEAFIDGCMGSGRLRVRHPIKPELHKKTEQVRGLVRLDDTHVSDRQVLQLARKVLLGRPDPRKPRIIHGQPRPPL